MVHTSEISLHMNGNTDIRDITKEVAHIITQSGISDGIACVFVIGSTAGITTVEFEPGLVENDIPRLFEQIASKDAHYDHEATWNDDNGHSHVRASLLGPSLSVPFSGQKLALGTWQQIIVIDFDTRPRQREIVVQLVGE
ncbi:MAG: secondary thiamine-phosphate synthase enzyme YjbQ [bacterium]